MSGNQRSSAATGGVAGPVAAALAVLAVLAVVTAGVVAGVEGLGGSPGADPGPPSPAPTEATSGATEEETDEPATFFPDGQVIVGDRRDNADIEVPSVDEGWEVQAPRDVRGFQSETPDGETVSVGVTGPALWKPLTCEDEYGYEVDSPRAFAGFTAPGEDDGEADAVRRANEQTTEQWLRVFRLAGDDLADPSYDSTTISDGTPARRARILTVPTGDRGKGSCDATAIEISLLSFDSGDYVSTVVLSRLVADDGSDLDSGLPADVADQVLASPRLQETP
ncbi:hypothetical protein [uncultured Nocardioides sp.]|uniref:hypothetical protein n=1 Tax=uncultured Nocardioides sp. TaxID=198441 RepID=UPI00261DCB2F|nr:hypothetical protein [uncultured Nocardioides sp.]